MYLMKIEVNKLKLNDGKTEYIVMSRQHNRLKITNDHIQIGSAAVMESQVVRNLGVMFVMN